MQHHANDGPEKVSPHLRNKIAIANSPPRPRKVRHDAEIIPFPAIKQKCLADDALIATCDLSDDDADRFLSAVIRRHARRLQKLGIAPDRIAADVADLECAFGLASDSEA